MSVTELPLGPKPGRAEPVASISKARAAVLERLRQLDGTLSVEQLATQTGQHANTVREHLEALTGMVMPPKQLRPRKAGAGLHGCTRPLPRQPVLLPTSPLLRP
ncbi:hypothetical protein NHF46_20495 [Arthrobacter alpinus]|nr:hypothetical protein [Arthrobacter alpinus]